MNEVPKQKKARLQFILIAFAFVGPLLIAVWLYFQGAPLQPAGRTNHGALLEPIVNLRDKLPESPIHNYYEDSWLLVHPHAGPCDGPCRVALHTIRQSRLMLGKEMGRLRRVLLHGDSALDTVFLAEEHPGLITIEDGSLNGLLHNKKPADLPPGGYFLIDPLGNLVMYFQPDLDPSQMVDDIKRLLKLSRIG
jgi:hypothetical protein